MVNAHTFHIPVMGIGYTIDTPIKVAHLGIDSVISLVDDILLEKLRKMYCGKYKIPYTEITDKIEDFRAKRITSYLDLVKTLVEQKFEDFKNTTIEKGSEIKDFFNLLPDSSSIKQEFRNLTSKHFNINEVRLWVKENLSIGSIDVNIMTKVDKFNFFKGEKLPAEFNDAHAALRGFAKSKLNSSIVLSAGMNPRLYGYMEQFEDFFPAKNWELKKKIVLKVSDFKSALIQGKYLAKKGLWISEYRVESGLNCGGHAFATDGFLLGPILAEFKNKRDELIQSVHEVLQKAFANKNRSIPEQALPLKITAQGGVGTAEEHQFLIDEYSVDSVGWATPFLLVPEAVTVEDATLKKLTAAREDDLYLSNISPLGIPFSNLRDNSKDAEKASWIKEGKPGSPCPKRYVTLNYEFNEKGLCTASRQYQKLKIKELEKENLPAEKHQIEYDKIVEKACICVGLGTSSLLANSIETKVEGPGVSVCPGPNLAYFSKTMKLKEMIDHIYGRSNMITRTDRPHMFIKELNIYIDYLKDKLKETGAAATRKQSKYLQTFADNMKEGIEYYISLFSNLKEIFEDSRSSVLNELDESLKTLRLLNLQIETLPLIK
ncbi:MAG: hypothetical protein U9N86_18835 [Bacteroidota bacterium]|nr:hypothetical protein [Bacteroidota bacterium]